MLDVFDILEPSTVAEAVGLLAEHGDDASLYAGGTELLLVMKEGLARFPYLVNLKTVPELGTIALSDDSSRLEIGALATHRQLERVALVRQHAPVLSEMESMVANVRVRAVGTLGGNLCFAEPHSDPATLLLAWGAEIELASTEGRRTLPIDQFMLGMFETARQPGEVMTRVLLPLLPDGTAGAYVKFATHERPTATVAALVRVQDGVVAAAHLAVGSVGPTPVRVTEAEDLMRGEAPSEALLQAAAEYARRAVEPTDDLYGAEDYKRHLAGVLTGRALRQALAKAGHELL